MENFNTTDASQKTLIYPFYTIFGSLFPKINFILLFHLLSLVFDLILCLVILFCSYLFLKNYYYSLLALVLIGLGGGLGWAIKMSADINMPGITFFSSFQRPHDALSSCFYLLSLSLFYLSVKRGKHILSLISLLFLLLIIPFSPYRLLSYFMITALFAAINYKNTATPSAFRYIAINLIITLPLGLAYYYHFSSSSYSSLLSYQPSPISIFSLILGWAPLLPIFIWQLMSKKSPAIYFLYIWFLVSFLLALLPFGLARLFYGCSYFPLLVINLLFLQKLAKKDFANSLALTIILFFFTLPSFFYIYAKRLEAIKEKNSWYYLPEELQDAFNFLEKQEKDGVLVLEPVNTYIPAFTGKKVYFGHKDQTPGYDEKTAKALAFYASGQNENEAKTFLQENNNQQFPGPDYSFLQTVFNNNKVEILSP